MRRFVDPKGRAWEVVVGRESWGSFVAIFVPVDGAGDVRQSALAATGHEEASAQLERLDERDLCDLLERGVRNELSQQ
jgi:hypothetical protein